MKRITLNLAATVLAVTLFACKSSPSARPRVAVQPPTDTHDTALDPATLGHVEGTVTLKGRPPAPLKIDTSMDPACGLSGGPDPVAQQYVVQNGKLANVFLYVKSGPPAAMSAPALPTAPVVMDQKGCIYTPHVVALMQGNSVEFHNDDPTMHNIHTAPANSGNAVVDVSQGPHGAPKLTQFPQPEIMLPVRCNNHPWMNAFINVSATPFFAVTDAAGRFHLDGLPSGDYTLAAVHEKLGEQTIAITIKPRQTAKADLIFAIN